MCNEHVDTIEHFMIQCKKTHTFWNQILNWWTKCMKVIFRLDTYEILFGIHNDEMMACYHLYRCKKVCFEMDTEDFLLECNNHLRLEESIMAAKNQPQKCTFPYLGPHQSN